MIGKKTAVINIRIAPELKKRLKDKAKQQNLDLTSYIQKVATEPVIFLDNETLAILRAFKPNV